MKAHAGELQKLEHMDPRPRALKASGPQQGSKEHTSTNTPNIDDRISTCDQSFIRQGCKDRVKGPCVEYALARTARTAVSALLQDGTRLSGPAAELRVQRRERSLVQPRKEREICADLNVH